MHVQSKIFKDRSRNSTSFKMELFGTIGNWRKLQRASSHWLTTNEHYLQWNNEKKKDIEAKEEIVYENVFIRLNTK